VSNQVKRNSDHGQTLAAWVLTVSAIIGSALIALGIFLEVDLVWLTGIVIATFGSVISFILHQLGYGQKPKL